MLMGWQFKKTEDIDRFFNELSSIIKRKKVDIFLLGGCALILSGLSRTTQDIDFEVKPGEEDLFEKIQKFCSERTIAANFSEDASRWGMISISSDRSRCISYKRFGNINVYIMNPLDIIVGKMERFTTIDEEDILFLIKRYKIDSKDLINGLADGIRRSIRSEKLFTFKKVAENFLKAHSKESWGIEPGNILELWHKAISN